MNISFEGGYDSEITENEYDMYGQRYPPNYWPMYHQRGQQYRLNLFEKWVFLSSLDLTT